MTPDDRKPIVDAEEPPVRDRMLGTWAICAGALGLWFLAVWIIFGDMI